MEEEKSPIPSLLELGNTDMCPHIDPSPDRSSENEFMEMRILLVSDVHSRVDHCAQLGKWLVERRDT